MDEIICFDDNFLSLLKNLDCLWNTDIDKDSPDIHHS